MLHQAREENNNLNNERSDAPVRSPVHFTRDPSSSLPPYPGNCPLPQPPVRWSILLIDLDSIAFSFWTYEDNASSIPEQFLNFA